MPWLGSQCQGSEGTGAATETWSVVKDGSETHLIQFAVIYILAMSNLRTREGRKEGQANLAQNRAGTMQLL